MIVRIIKEWEFPDFLKQTPDGLGIWDGIRFTAEEVEECDYVIVLNRVDKEIALKCPPKNVWAVMQEPYIPGIFEWMVRGHQQFAKVFTHHVFSTDAKYISSYPMLPWHVQKSYDELVAMKKPPDKTREISSIVSNKAFFPGHKKRLKFLERLRQADVPHIDFYGKGTCFIEDKWDGLSSYRYSLALENSQSPDYWTEKLADCFLAYTMPIYYGCDNLEAYFPEGSFIRIDIEKPDEAVRIIKEAIETDCWSRSFEALEEARRRVLTRYNLFATLSRVIRDEQSRTPAEPSEITLKPYVPPLWLRGIGKIKRLLHG